MTDLQTRWWQLSLREVLGVTAFVAVACGALPYASPMWVTWLLTLLVVLIVGFATVAFVDRGRRQAKAIGALLAIFMYGLLWNFDLPVREAYDHTGLRPTRYEGYLPTTVALNHLWKRMKGIHYIEQETGVVIEAHPGFGPDTTEGKEIGTAGPPGWNGGYVVLKTLPVKKEFYPVGHLLFAFAFGFAGSRFGAWVYQRRLAEDKSESASGDT